MRIRGGLAISGAIVVTLALAETLGAQAICSAPHSSPTLAQSGSLSTLPQGGGWIQLSAYGQRADQFFSPSGSRQSFLANSEFTTRSAFITGAVGLLDGVELWAQLPVHNLQVQGQGGDSESSGVGDIRVATRLGANLFGLDIPVAARLAAKIPGSDFPVDATVLPLTEGQRDWEVSLESGYALSDQGIYLMAWAGYRWRELHEEVDRDPGDEIFGHLAVGGSVGPLSWEVAGDGLWGKAPISQGFLLVGDVRRLIQVLPTVGMVAGPGRLELSAQVPVWGKNLPIGTGFSLGYRMTWGLTPDPTATLLDFIEK